jgi:hypothetical protein
VKPKKKIKPWDTVARLVIAAGQVAKQWPDKEELERIGIAENGQYPSFRSPDILLGLTRIAGLDPRLFIEQNQLGELKQISKNTALVAQFVLRSTNGNPMGAFSP